MWPNKEKHFSETQTLKTSLFNGITGTVLTWLKYHLRISNKTVLKNGE